MTVVWPHNIQPAPSLRALIVIFAVVCVRVIDWLNNHLVRHIVAFNLGGSLTCAEIRTREAQGSSHQLRL